MYQCQYCGRYLKSAYDNCPGCGSNSIRKISSNGVIKVNNIPKGGYKINLNNIKKDNMAGILLTVMGVIFLAMSLPSFVMLLGFSFLFSGTTDGSFFGNTFFLFDIPFVVIGIAILYFGIRLNKKHKEKIKKIKYLTQNGVLIKNLPYEVKPSGTVINGRPVYCILVNYELDNGTKIPLQSEGKYDGKLSRADGTVDLLIDPNDFSNYFIDFEIY